MGLLSNQLSNSILSEGFLEASKKLNEAARDLYFKSTPIYPANPWKKTIPYNGIFES